MRLLRFIRHYKVLAIESSCDDSCVALLEKSPFAGPRIIDHTKRTLNSQPDGGIVPTKAVDFHQQQMARMVHDFCTKHNLIASPPDLICCTRGPGMVGSLSTGLQLAKGLAIAWNKPLIGVHHMLGHLLISNLQPLQSPQSPQESSEASETFQAPQYPFLSLLASGGHTMLVLLKSLTEHEVVVDTCDIAVGDSIDKCAREIGIHGNLLGKELEKYVDRIPQDLKTEFDAISTHTRHNEFDYKLKLPLRGPHNSLIPEKIQFTFAPFLSTTQHHLKRNAINERTRQFLAYKTQQFMFKHIIDRLNVAFMKHGCKETKVKGDHKFDGIRDFVLSGGVASNRTFRAMLQLDLKTDLISDVPLKYHFPEVSLCTDNAVMIGVAGIQIFEELKLKSDLGIIPIRKWPMDSLLKVDGWRDAQEEVKSVNSCK